MLKCVVLICFLKGLRISTVYELTSLNNELLQIPANPHDIPEKNRIWNIKTWRRTVKMQLAQISNYC